MRSRSVFVGTATALVLAPAAMAGDVEWLPPNPPSDAAAGECYVRVRIEPEYDAWSERIVTQDAYERYDALPPRLREERRDYVSREAGVRYVVHEPVYETITERVQIRPAYTEYVVQPARHDTVTETVLIREPRMVWRRGNIPGATMRRYDAETGDVWCLVEEAGEYRTVTRNVVVEPAQIREVSYPAEYATIQREVLVTPARVEEIPIEPRYASYSYEVLDRPASVDHETIAERSETITRYRMRSQERWEWRLVDCDEVDLDGEHPPMSPAVPPVADRSAPSSSNHTYLYGGEEPQETTTSEEVPVAQASWSGQRRPARSQSRY